MKWIIALIVVLGLFTVVCHYCGTTPVAQVSGYDVLAKPGESVRLRAQIKGDAPGLLGRTLKGRVVNFYEENGQIGAGVSSEDGIAWVDFVIPGENSGDFTVSCGLSLDDKYRAENDGIYVAVSSENTPILITDIDHTIANISTIKFLLTPNEEVPEMDGASEALRKLSKEYRIVYLSARDTTFRAKTKEWLSMYNFPPGPLFTFDEGRYGMGVEDYKSRTIADIKANFPNTVVGVGDKPADCRAYMASGLKAFYIGADEKKAPEGSIIVKSWSEVLKHLTE